MKILILIPSLNDNNHLPTLIQQIQQNIDEFILVIDDGSIIPISINNENVKIIRNEINLGKGGALIEGVKYAFQNGYTHVITIDSDLQHDPKKLIDFKEFDETYELVCGQRIIDKQMPLHRKLSNKLTSWIISILCGQPIFDSQCGYRRYSVQGILDAHCTEKGFQFESEVLLKFSRMNKKIGHILIPTIYGDESSSIRNSIDTFKFIKLIFGNIWLKR